MTEDDINTSYGRGRGQGRTSGEGLPEHDVRTALLELLADVGVVTATEAAARLGYSSGLCSFHLRQLARHGRIEEAPHSGGRARPWRLRSRSESPTGSPTGSPATSSSGFPTADAQFGDLARGLEDESWQRWLSRRDEVPDEWRHDEAFSAVAYLTPDEMSRVAEAVRQALAPYRDREQRPLARPDGARPVALISRLFPLLPEPGDEPGDEPRS
ncbi:winged helix-turn-helix domain-containing protein [Streptomyces cavernicola]|uniref:Winged helix-turn-helix domain-containing protein n=1 Tax=Streptomyces cavernicola TaxID=3043613 RepID=A0ABT6S3R4_9ACTN|nr:winged helix-turn-helix domain-containing protein [Streptomyces sp. B-S-A6]MDI3402739.1 winged helix-turn-helix domain-containing protein [Streptomyces sp. B-S-A6]